MTILECFTARLHNIEISKRQLEKEIQEYFKGKTIVINNKRFNGQPHGSSRPSLFGKGYTEFSVFVYDGDIFFQPHGTQSSLRLMDVIVE